MMKESKIITIAFILGAIIGLISITPEVVFTSGAMEYVLYVLMLVVGVSVGLDRDALVAMKRFRGPLMLFPLVILGGTLIGSLVACIFNPYLLITDALSIGSGMGYYSLSSVLINNVRGEVAATTALLSNMFREIFTLLSAPLIVKYFGPFATIAAGGATSMDTTLPIVQRSSGNEYTILSVYSGVVLTVLVPILVQVFVGGIRI